MILFSRDKESISVLSAEDLKRRVADTVIQLRKEKKFNQADMAMKFQMSQVAYAKIENCKTDINLEKLFLFCEIFGISMAELLGLTNFISPDTELLISDLKERLAKSEKTVAEKDMMISLLVDKLSQFGHNVY